jgi:hypothetical protein
MASSGAQQQLRAPARLPIIKGRDLQFAEFSRTKPVLYQPGPSAPRGEALYLRLDGNGGIMYSEAPKQDPNRRALRQVSQDEKGVLWVPTDSGQLRQLDSTHDKAFLDELKLAYKQRGTQEDPSARSFLSHYFPKEFPANGPAPAPQAPAPAPQTQTQPGVPERAPHAENSPSPGPQSQRPVAEDSAPAGNETESSPPPATESADADSESDKESPGSVAADDEPEADEKSSTDKRAKAHPFETGSLEITGQQIMNAGRFSGKCHNPETDDMTDINIFASGLAPDGKTNMLNIYEGEEQMKWLNTAGPHTTEVAKKMHDETVAYERPRLTEVVLPAQDDEPEVTEVSSGLIFRHGPSALNILGRLFDGEKIYEVRGTSNYEKGQDLSVVWVKVTDSKTREVRYCQLRKGAPKKEEAEEPEKPIAKFGTYNIDPRTPDELRKAGFKESTYHPAKEGEESRIVIDWQKGSQVVHTLLPKSKPVQQSLPAEEEAKAELKEEEQKLSEEQKKILAELQKLLDQKDAEEGQAEEEPEAEVSSAPAPAPKASAPARTPAAQSAAPAPSRPAQPAARASANPATPETPYIHYSSAAQVSKEFGEGATATTPDGKEIDVFGAEAVKSFPNAEKIVFVVGSSDCGPCLAYGAELKDPNSELRKALASSDGKVVVRKIDRDKISGVEGLAGELMNLKIPDPSAPNDATKAKLRPVPYSIVMERVGDQAFVPVGAFQGFFSATSTETGAKAMRTELKKLLSGAELGRAPRQ